MSKSKKFHEADREPREAPNETWFAFLFPIANSRSMGLDWIRLDFFPAIGVFSSVVESRHLVIVHFVAEWVLPYGIRAWAITPIF